jgi:hypothetical protein
MRMPAMPAGKTRLCQGQMTEVQRAATVTHRCQLARDRANTHKTEHAQLEHKALTSVHILRGDADAVVVVEQRGVAVVGNDVVLQQGRAETSGYAC